MTRGRFEQVVPGIVMALLLPAVLSACGGAGAGSSSAGDGSRGTPAPSPSTRSATTPPPSRTPTARSSPTARGLARISKLLVFVVENHSLDEMRSQMPWTYAVARRYGHATAYRAMTHPSLPNYLAIAGGSTFGIADDNDPSAHPVHGPSVFGEAVAHGLTARVYADSMPSACFMTSVGEYAVRHNPWTYFVDERAACHTFDTPLGRYDADVRTGQLPDAGMVVPDVCHDAHDCSLATADAWLRREVGLAMSGPDFRSGHLVVVVTADEDDGTQSNTVLTVLIHPSLHGSVVTRPLSQLSLSRLYSEVLGLPPLRGARSAPSMASAFHLRLSRG